MTDSRADERDPGALEMAREFDRAFESPRRAAAPRGAAYLLVRLADRPYALAAREIRGLSPPVPIERLPDGVPGRVGLAFVSGKLVAVYDLASLCAEGSEISEVRRWLALAGPDGTLALAFDAFEGYREVSSERIVAADPAGASRSRFVREILHLDDGARPVVDVHAVVAAIEASSKSTPDR